MIQIRIHIINVSEHHIFPLVSCIFELTKHVLRIDRFSFSIKVYVESKIDNIIQEIVYDFLL